MTERVRGRTELEQLAVDELAVRVQWVIDKVWVTFRVRSSNGQFYELRPIAMEWPLEPRTLTEWKDVLHEALNSLAPSLAIQ
jgi:hypothetical protein